MIPMKEGSELFETFKQLLALEDLKALKNKDLETLMEVNTRITILTWAKEIVGNSPTELKDINDHYRVYRKFIESLLFVTPSDLREPHTNLKPHETAYVDMVHAVSYMKKKLFDDLRNKNISCLEEYQSAITKMTEECLVKWINFRNVIQPLEPLKEGEKPC